MAQSALSKAEANLSLQKPDAQTAFGNRAQTTTPTPAVTPETSSSHTLDIQEKMQEYLHENLKTLESQLKVDQQRQRDRVEEELHKVRQQLAATAQEQRQHHQNISVAVREMFEEMRKELSDALHRLSQDVDHTLRQAEAQNRQAIETLRDEMLRGLFQRDQATVKREVLGELLVTLGKRLQTTTEDGET